MLNIQLHMASLHNDHYAYIWYVAKYSQYRTQARLAKQWLMHHVVVMYQVQACTLTDDAHYISNHSHYTTLDEPVATYKALRKQLATCVPS